MYLLITLFAAIISTIIWYLNAENDLLRISTLCYMYWGASVMWFIDAVAEYAKLGAEYFTPSAADMINDSFLGFSAVAFGLVIWIIVLLVKDPKNIIKTAVLKRTDEFKER